jgi:hypothetical protein
MKETHGVKNANLQSFLQAQVLIANLSSMPHAQHDPFL